VQAYVHCALVTASVTDGRAARKAATRDAIADALLDLIAEGDLRPTAREIAAQAGISLRSVYVHFDDLEDLFCAAAARHLSRIAPMLKTIPATGAVRERAAALMQQRARLYDRMGNVARATQLQAPFSPTLERIVNNAHVRARKEIESVFAPELATLTPARRARLVALLDVITGAHAWDVLCGSHGLSPEDALTVVVDSVVVEIEAEA
jgi:AcrR family transcriptional regulator